MDSEFEVPFRDPVRVGDNANLNIRKRNSTQYVNDENNHIVTNAIIKKHKSKNIIANPIPANNQVRTNKTKYI